MKQFFKKHIRPRIRRLGFDIIGFDHTRRGHGIWQDLNFYLEGCPHPTIIDVGANMGQFATHTQRELPQADIHCFEPSPSTFEILKKNCAGFDKVQYWNYGMGSKDETLEFIENDISLMSSFLKPSKYCWGEVAKTTQVEVISLDSFAERENLDFIHVLKSDTQGFDFEVLKGARKLMEQKKVGLVYFEFNFLELYENQPALDEVYRYLTDLDYLLVSLYDFGYHCELAGWTDALFISRDFYEKRVDPADRPIGKRMT